MEGHDNVILTSKLRVRKNLEQEQQHPQHHRNSTTSNSSLAEPELGQKLKTGCIKIGDDGAQQAADPAIANSK